MAAARRGALAPALRSLRGGGRGVETGARPPAAGVLRGRWFRGVGVLMVSSGFVSGFVWVFCGFQLLKKPCLNFGVFLFMFFFDVLFFVRGDDENWQNWFLL